MWSMKKKSKWTFFSDFIEIQSAILYFTNLKLNLELFNLSKHQRGFFRNYMYFSAFFSHIFLYFFYYNGITEIILWGGRGRKLKLYYIAGLKDEWKFVFEYGIIWKRKSITLFRNAIVRFLRFFTIILHCKYWMIYWICHQ